MRVAIAALLLAAACAGVTVSASLGGTVVLIDGFEASGVAVALVETGAETWTDTGGAFSFDGLAAGTYTLAFAEGDVEVDVPRGGRVDVEVTVRGDGVAARSGDARTAVARLRPTADAEGVVGRVKVAARGERQLFLLCVKGLAAGDVVVLVIDGAEVGEAAAGDDGQACWRLGAGELPLGVAAVGELGGLGIEVLSGDVVVLVGEVPALPEPRERPAAPPDDRGVTPRDRGEGEPSVGAPR
jgi:hypothetical protein